MLLIECYTGASLFDQLFKYEVLQNSSVTCSCNRDYTNDNINDLFYNYFDLSLKTLEVFK